MTGITSSPPIVPLRIQIGGDGSPPFKSIDELEWRDIPPLAVLTGINGTGKSQLLELLAYKLTGTHHPEVGLIQTRVEISDDSITPDSVAYIPSRWALQNAPGFTLGAVNGFKSNILGPFRQRGQIGDVAMSSRQAQLHRITGTTNLSSMDALSRIPDNFAFMLNEVNATEGLAYVFVAYRVRAAEMREKGVVETEIRRQLGEPPWDVVNNVLADAEFPYRITSPLETGLFEPYDMRLVNADRGVLLHPTDLSSGEQILLALILWLYNSRHHGRFARLLLLDEPDAYLHPTLTRQYLDVVNESLVGRFGARVIMTTHSPSTVALAPEGSVFEMTRERPRIKRSSSASAIAVLTAGLVTVSPGTRFVLVEDFDDVHFYETIRDVLTDYGPRRDPMAMNPVPTVVFLAASIQRDGRPIGGGRSVVSGWVERFDQAPLNEILRGIIDRDSGNVGTPRIKVIGRYSIENYLLDPIVVFGARSAEGRAPSLANVNVSRGDEHLVRDLSETQLQSIVDEVTSRLELSLSSLSPPERDQTAVAFTNGKSLRYPNWMLTRRGRDLLQVYQSVFGASLITPPNLRRALRHVRLIPRELANMMAELQAEL